MEEKIESHYKFCQRLIKEIQPKKTTLIVVDMQKYQVQKDFIAYKAMNTVTPGILDYFVSEVEKKLTPNLRTLINFCHDIGISVIYTKYSSFMPDGSDLPKSAKNLNNVAKDLLGDVAFPHISHPSSDIIGELKPEDRDFVLQKNTSGTFISTRLDSFLRNMDIETVLVSGVVTNFCVHSTAREAADYGFQVVIVEDCCAAWTPEIHQAALTSFGLIYGFVLTYEKVIKKIARTTKKIKEQVAVH
ncbi:MAG: cysteine hydrolase [Candidatus Lokiarchaeota archaeon]|nr:cysteine hydrolase [Candidatus Lokiarchaeota archaeon]